MKMTYQEKMYCLWRKAVKQKDIQAQIYYEEQFDNSACNTWETFKKSWAGQEWIKKHFSGIQ